MYKNLGAQNDSLDSPMMNWLCEPVDNSRGGIEWQARNGTVAAQKKKEDIQQDVLRQMAETFKTRDHAEMFRHMRETHYPEDYQIHQGNSLPRDFNIDPDQAEFFKLMMRIDESFDDLPSFLRDDQAEMHYNGHRFGEIFLKRRTSDGKVTKDERYVQHGPMMHYFVRFLQQLEWGARHKPHVKEALDCLSRYPAVKDFCDNLENIVTRRWNIYGATDIGGYIRDQEELERFSILRRTLIRRRLRAQIFERQSTRNSTV